MNKLYQMKIRMKKIILLTFGFMLFGLFNAKSTEIKFMNDEALTEKEKHIVLISSYTAQGKLEKLKEVLHSGVAAGLSVNEIKEILVHSYAYCGFPRSIRGLQTFMEVLRERKAKGLTADNGKVATKISKDSVSKYQRGKVMLENLTGIPQADTLSGYAAFAPVIDTFLKEHLFADIFERDILSFRQRELVTISVISAIGDAEPMLKSHMAISLRIGITPNQLKSFVNTIEPSIEKEKSVATKRVVSELLKTKI